MNWICNPEWQGRILVLSLLTRSNALGLLFSCAYSLSKGRTLIQRENKEPSRLSVVWIINSNLQKPALYCASFLQKQVPS